MWVQKLTLKNIKCFQDTEVVFTHGGERRSWITLLGENGVGKSVILQALGLLLAGPEAAKALLPRPTGWVGNVAQPGQLSIVIHQEEQDPGIFGEEKARRAFSYTYHVAGDQPVQIGSKTCTEPAILEKPSTMLRWLKTHVFAAASPGGWFAAGYGAFRRLAGVSQAWLPNLEPPTRASNFQAQFDEDRALSSFERWLVDLDSRQAQDPQDVSARRMREIGARAITRLLPGTVNIAEVTAAGLILLEVNGKRVPTSGLSDGFRNVIALSGDLIWRLLQAFPDLDDPTQAPGVVLIDEPDIHLHPVWQREIAGWLRAVFPHLQFIVATHSPFVAMGAGEDTLTLRLEAAADGGIRITESPDLSAYDVDRALRSPAFGLPSTFSPQTESRMREYHELGRRRRALDALDTQKLQRLERFMKGIEQPAEEGSLEKRIADFLRERLP
jgi:energy-coupling factor transporter ATP-binding protein EcfA2